jgi:CBS domain-containing protein
VQIAELLARKGASVATVRPDASVRQVLAELARWNIGALVVSRDGSNVEGIVSERDVVRRLDRFGPAILEEPVRTIMSAEVQTCVPGDTLDSLAATMTEHRVRHVPVLEGERLVGIVSIGDVVKARIDELQRDRDELEHYIIGR